MCRMAIVRTASSIRDNPTKSQGYAVWCTQKALKCLRSMNMTSMQAIPRSQEIIMEKGRHIILLRQMRWTF